MRQVDRILSPLIIGVTAELCGGGERPERRLERKRADAIVYFLMRAVLARVTETSSCITLLEKSEWGGGGCN
jgi:hypothetical protein